MKPAKIQDACDNALRNTTSILGSPVWSHELDSVISTSSAQLVILHELKSQSQEIHNHPCPCFFWEMGMGRNALLSTICNAI